MLHAKLQALTAEGGLAVQAAYMADPRQTCTANGHTPALMFLGYCSLMQHTARDVTQSTSSVLARSITCNS